MISASVNSSMDTSEEASKTTILLVSSQQCFINSWSHTFTPAADLTGEGMCWKGGEKKDAEMPKTGLTTQEVTYIYVFIHTDVVFIFFSLTYAEISRF